MKKRDKTLEELTRACREMISVCKQHSYLWDDGEIKSLCIADGFIAQDDTFNIDIERNGNKEFVFNGRNFGCWNIAPLKEGYCAEEAAQEIEHRFGNFSGMSADELRRDFYSELKKPLEKYYGRKVVEKIKLGEN